jgi:hypothetical protein
VDGVSGVGAESPLASGELFVDYVRPNNNLSFSRIGLGLSTDMAIRKEFASPVIGSNSNRWPTGLNVLR